MLDEKFLKSFNTAVKTCNCLRICTKRKCFQVHRPLQFHQMHRPSDKSSWMYCGGA